MPYLVTFQMRSGEHVQLSNCTTRVYFDFLRDNCLNIKSINLLKIY